MIPRDEILSMAREAGLLTVTVSKAVGEIRKDRIVNFANMVATKVIARTPPPPLFVSMSDVDQAQLAAMLDKRQPMLLVAAPDGAELAACFDQIKSELIADGAVEHDLGLEFFPEAVLDAFRRQRTARIEAQVENEALKAELAKARTPLTDSEWLEYILRNGSKSDVHIATYEGVATTGAHGMVIRLQHDANNLRKLVEAAHGIGEKT